MERRTTTGGFTIIELTIVVLLIAILASLAVPNVLNARMRANETAAVSMLRTIGTGQSQYQTKGVTDPDEDGTGSYGYFAEMSGLVVPRGSTEVLTPPILSSQFRLLLNGRVKHSGYYFRLFLPEAAGTGIGELATGGAPATVDPNLSETAWCCYAWPINTQSGQRVFATNQRGDVISSSNGSVSQNYNGSTEPQPDAAFVSPATDDSILGVLAIGTVGTDGGLWVSVQ